MPTVVAGLAGLASSIIIGIDYACARVSDGVQCWGNNIAGQYGSGNFVTTPFPQYTAALFVGAPQALSPVTSITPVYTWKAVRRATGYNLRINGTSYSYSAAQVNCPDGVDLCTITGAALPPGTHFWQVQQMDSYGNGNWSALLQFTL